MRPNDVTTISPEDHPSWRKAASRVTRETGLRFEFLPFLDIGIDVKCLPKRNRGAQPKYQEIHELEVGEIYRTSNMRKNRYASAISRIERDSDKRFLLTSDERGLTIKRLPDLANKRDYRVPKSKYDLDRIPVGSYRKFNQTANQTRVSNAVDDYTRRSNGLFRFKKEWRDGDLYVHRTQ